MGVRVVLLVILLFSVVAAALFALEMGLVKPVSPGAPAQQGASTASPAAPTKERCSSIVVRYAYIVRSEEGDAIALYLCEVGGKPHYYSPDVVEVRDASGRVWRSSRVFVIYGEDRCWRNPMILMFTDKGRDLSAQGYYYYPYKEDSYARLILKSLAPYPDEHLVTFNPPVVVKLHIPGCGWVEVRVEEVWRISLYHWMPRS